MAITARMPSTWLFDRKRNSHLPRQVLEAVSIPLKLDLFVESCAYYSCLVAITLQEQLPKMTYSVRDGE